MKKNTTIRTFCNGLILLALLLAQNISIAQIGLGEQAGLTEQSAADLEKAAEEKFMSGHPRENMTPEEKVQAIKDCEEAAKLYDQAAKAYRKEGNEEKAKAMEGSARAARSNAKLLRSQEKEESYSIAPSSPIWGDISIADRNAKVLSSAYRPRFHLAFVGNLLLGDLAPQSVPLADLQNAVFAPGTAEQLFQQLGGEFFLGDISGQAAPAFSMSGTTRATFGARLGLRLGQRFELQAGGQSFRSEWSGNFPVVVLPQQQHPPMPPQTLQGSLSASASGILAEMDAAFFLTNGAVRPYLKAGVRGIFPTENKSGADIAGVALPLEIEPIETAFSPFGGAGLRVGFLKNGFVEAGASYGKVPGGDYAPSVEAGLGWRF